MDTDAALAAELGHRLGEDALAWFGLALLLLLALVALLWWGLSRVVLAPRFSRLPPLAFLLLRLGLGFGIVLGAGAVFAEMVDAMDAEEELGRFDEALAGTLRTQVAPGVLQAFALLTRLGDAATLVALGGVVTLVLLVLRRRWLALAWALALAGNGLLNPLLKSLFQRVRPLHEHGLVLEQGWSFPSGHSSGAVVTYGMLAYVLLRLVPQQWHLPVVLTAAALIFSVGCSRVFLQVHYASDVIAGFASGLGWLVVCVLSVELLRAYRRSRRRAPR